MEGVDLTVAGEALGAIARKAIDRKTVARGLRSIMEAILLHSMFDLPSLEGVKEIMISQQVVEGTAGHSTRTPVARGRSNGASARPCGRSSVFFFNNKDERWTCPTPLNSSPRGAPSKRLNSSDLHHPKLKSTRS